METCLGFHFGERADDFSEFIDPRLDGIWIPPKAATSFHALRRGSNHLDGVEKPRLADSGITDRLVVPCRSQKTQGILSSGGELQTVAFHRGHQAAS
jgi:hypothetical protein